MILHSDTESLLLKTLYKTDITHTFVEQEVAFLDNVFVESVFCFPSDSVINFSPIHCVSKNLFLVLQ